MFDNLRRWRVIGTVFNWRAYNLRLNCVIKIWIFVAVFCHTTTLSGFLFLAWCRGVVFVHRKCTFFTVATFCKMNPWLRYFRIVGSKPVVALVIYFVELHYHRGIF